MGLDLSQFVLKGHLHPIDLFFADHMGAQTEEEKALLAELMAVSRQGHICLDTDNLSLKDLEQDERLFWQRSVQEGAKKFFPISHVVRFENLFYLSKNWTYETQILDNIQRLLNCDKNKSYHLMKDGLTKQQQEALELVLKHPLSLITGGPGTGKTFVAKALLQSMGTNAHVILTAPTGKAASRLKQLNPQATCGTLHSILGIKSERDLKLEGGFLQADLIIVDESSMIDLYLFAYFLSSIQKGTKVVFMGDGDQLPPVESGSIFSDLIGHLPTAYLTRSMRSDRKEILDLAAAIKEGKNTISCISECDILKIAEDNFLPASLSKPSDLKCFEHFRMLSSIREGPLGVDTINQRIFDHMKDLAHGKELLVPILFTRTDYAQNIYNGDSGILVYLQQKASYVLLYQPRLKNSLFDGAKTSRFEDSSEDSIELIQSSEESSNREVFRTSPKSYFSTEAGISDKDKEVRKLPFFNLPSYEYAYCLSVHKSQGSEFDKVLLFLPPGSEVFGREILYTGVTRARHDIQICSTPDIVNKILVNFSRKTSGIGRRLLKLK